MKILVINCGSSSIKYRLYDSANSKVVAQGIVARIGESKSYLNHMSGEQNIQEEKLITSHVEGFQTLIDALLHKDYGVISNISEIVAVGHRVVHGGDAFTQSTLITDKVIAKIEECVPLAPLHNPANLLGIRETMRLLPGTPNVAVFDTSFHMTMPPKAYLYAIPIEYSSKFRIRRYGFHGTSLRYVSQVAAQIIQKPIEELKMIICHLGNGVSLTAIEHGKSVDTSMGLTPLEGLVMGTRSGDIDPGAIFYMTRRLGMSIDRIDDLLNRESGILGISGYSNDLRDVEALAKKGDERCQLALEMFAYRVKKYIGAYTAILGKIDVLVFTAGIGEHSAQMRAMICEGMEPMGIGINQNKNQQVGDTDCRINLPTSLVTILVVSTNEEEMIFKDTLAIV